MSTIVTKKVKLKGVVVEELEIPQYESVAEAQENVEEKLLLALINRQIATDMANAARGKYREGEPGKKKRYELSFNLLPTVTFEDGSSGIDKLVACAGDKVALDALLNTPEVQAAVDAKLGESA